MALSPDLMKKHKSKRTSRPRSAPKARAKSRLVSQRPVGLEQLLPYPAHGVLTCELSIERMEPDPDRAWDRRFENARSIVADWLNACRTTDRRSFSKASFDIWIGHDTADRASANMFICLATTGRLPSYALLQQLEQFRPARFWRWGKQPIELGCFPTVHVEMGELTHAWDLNGAFLIAASERYRRRHGLAVEANDPYRQMLAGAVEPAVFETTPGGSAVLKGPKLYLFEVINDGTARKGLSASQPHDVVSIGDLFDLDEQLRLASVDIASADLDPWQRLQHVRYVRPALRAYCTHVERHVPAWLANDKYERISGKSALTLFGVSKLGVRAFSPLKKPEFARVETGRQVDDE